MPTISKKYHCGSCETGIVQKCVKETSRTIQAFTKKCDKCGAEYGLIKINELKPVAPLVK